ncbi:MAG: hypothetical protein IPK63_04570 [Candidatus Competibacteraceae bacterium]|nr:hypothetical protein [Candidatus Competibacteraceae bacterium]
MTLPIMPLLAGTDDSYLREIEEEAKRQATALIAPQSLPALALPTPKTNNSEQLKPGLDRAGFEQALRAGLPKETHAAFQRLSPADQQRIYESYRADSRLARISEQIIRLAGKP